MPAHHTLSKAMHTTKAALLTRVESGLRSAWQEWMTKMWRHVKLLWLAHNQFSTVLFCIVPMKDAVLYIRNKHVVNTRENNTHVDIDGTTGNPSRQRRSKGSSRTVWHEVITNAFVCARTLEEHNWKRYSYPFADKPFYEKEQRRVERSRSVRFCAKQLSNNKEEFIHSQSIDRTDATSSLHS